MAYKLVKREYASWKAMPERTKVNLGLPTTKAAFADLKGVTSRTLRRWEKQDDFQEMVEASRKLNQDEMFPDLDALANKDRLRKERESNDERVVKGREVGEQAFEDLANLVEDEEVELGESADENSYLLVRDRIVRDARKGDTQAQQLYLKYWGKSWVDAEKEDIAGLAHLSDEELTEQVLELVGPERVSTWLGSRP